MLYTGKGDNGTTSLFDCDQGRLSKDHKVIEALGAVDELNSLLGLVKVKSRRNVAKVIGQLQQNLFIIQAEIAGAGKTIDEDKVAELEELIKSAESKLPPIKTFFVSGGTELAALFDYARTVARRAERRVVAIRESKISVLTLAYLNRLSSLLFAFARLINHQSGIKEESPHYQ